nr:hypothetical protein [uncultured Desulfobacter sp.]
MDSKNVLSKGIQVVAFLFAAFGGFLLKIAPPGGITLHFAVGISSIASIFILLFITSVMKNQPQISYRKFWLSISAVSFFVVMGSSLLYFLNFSQMTFTFPPGSEEFRYTSGTILTPSAVDYLKENPLKTISELVADFGGPAHAELIWIRHTIQRSNFILILNYIFVLLSVSTMLFCLTEGILSNNGKKTTV